MAPALKIHSPVIHDIRQPYKTAGNHMNNRGSPMLRLRIFVYLEYHIPRVEPSVPNPIDGVPIDAALSHVIIAILHAKAESIAADGETDLDF